MLLQTKKILPLHTILEASASATARIRFRRFFRRRLFIIEFISSVCQSITNDLVRGLILIRKHQFIYVIFLIASSPHFKIIQVVRENHIILIERKLCGLSFCSFLSLIILTNSRNGFRLLFHGSSFRSSYDKFIFCDVLLTILRTKPALKHFRPLNKRTILLSPWAVTP